MSYNFLLSKNLYTTKKDLVNRFPYQNPTELPRIIKLRLNFNCRTNEAKKLAAASLALELLTGVKPEVMKSHSDHTALNLRKGDVNGVQITLKKRMLEGFLTYLILEASPVLNGIRPPGRYGGRKGSYDNKKSRSMTISITLADIIKLEEIEQNFQIFEHLPRLNISLIFDKPCTPNEQIFVTAPLFHGHG